jgi:ribosome maturation factor RimP
MADVVALITDQLEQLLPNPEHFIVEVSYKPVAGRSRLVIFLDADNGLDIETCAIISRQISGWIEEVDLIAEAFILEVSSPGLDYPLTGERMYRKNTGRVIKVLANDGTTTKGLLTETSDTGFSMMPEVKKKPKKGEPPIAPVQFTYCQVKKALVQVTFGNLPD